MSLDKFDYAIQAARQAHVERDQAKFMEAIDQAKFMEAIDQAILAIAAHPTLTVRLAKAQDSFPTLEALQIIRQVSGDVDKIRPR